MAATLSHGSEAATRPALASRHAASPPGWIQAGTRRRFAAGVAGGAGAASTEIAGASAPSSSVSVRSATSAAAAAASEGLYRDGLRALSSWTGAAMYDVP